MSTEYDKFTIDNLLDISRTDAESAGDLAEHARVLRRMSTAVQDNSDLVHNVISTLFGEEDANDGDAAASWHGQSARMMKTELTRLRDTLIPTPEHITNDASAMDSLSTRVTNTLITIDTLHVRAKESNEGTNGAAVTQARATLESAVNSYLDTAHGLPDPEFYSGLRKKSDDEPASSEPSGTTHPAAPSQRSAPQPQHDGSSTAQPVLQDSTATAAPPTTTAPAPSTTNTGMSAPVPTGAVPAVIGVRPGTGWQAPAPAPAAPRPVTPPVIRGGPSLQSPPTTAPPQPATKHSDPPAIRHAGQSPLDSPYSPPRTTVPPVIGGRGTPATWGPRSVVPAAPRPVVPAVIGRPGGRIAGPTGPRTTPVPRTVSPAVIRAPRPAVAPGSTALGPKPREAAGPVGHGAMARHRLPMGRTTGIATNGAPNRAINRGGGFATRSVVTGTYRSDTSTNPVKSSTAGPRELFRRLPVSTRYVTSDGRWVPQPRSLPQPGKPVPGERIMARNPRQTSPQSASPAGQRTKRWTKRSEVVAQRSVFRGSWQRRSKTGRPGQEVFANSTAPPSQTEPAIRAPLASADGEDVWQQQPTVRAVIGSHVSKQ